MKALQAYWLFGLLSLSLLVMGAETNGTENGPVALTLTDEVKAMDSALFDAYNRCDLRTFSSLLTDQVELYHDQNGAAFGKENVIAAVADAPCGAIRRELVAGTLQVYPIHGYGAVEMGAHRFYPTSAPNAAPISDAKFIIIWHLKDGSWKATRLISYGHEALH